MVSPDGRQIATVAGSSQRFSHALYVLNVQTGEVHWVASDYRDPIWLSSGELAATRVEKCPGFACNPNDWRAAGGARIDLKTGRTTPIGLRATLLGDVDVLYE